MHTTLAALPAKGALFPLWTSSTPPRLCPCRVLPPEKSSSDLGPLSLFPIFSLSFLPTLSFPFSFFLIYSCLRSPGGPLFSKCLPQTSAREMTDTKSSGRLRLSFSLKRCPLRPPEDTGLSQRRSQVSRRRNGFSPLSILLKAPRLDWERCCGGGTLFPRGE